MSPEVIPCVVFALLVTIVVMIHVFEMRRMTRAVTRVTTEPEPEPAPVTKPTIGEQVMANAERIAHLKGCVKAAAAAEFTLAEFALTDTQIALVLVSYRERAAFAREQLNSLGVTP